MIYEYHRFGTEESDYEWSRTYEQFRRDLDFLEEVRMDDGYKSQIIACKMAQEKGIKVYLGITTDFIGKENYMTWNDVKELGKYHVICNHSHQHAHFDKESEAYIGEDIAKAKDILENNTWQEIKYYLPTYNYVDQKIKNVCKRLDLKILDKAIPVSNNYDVQKIKSRCRN